MDQYGNFIRDKILGVYEYVLIIDVLDDKIYKYVYTDNKFSCVSMSSYIDYCNSCRQFIYEDDVQNYIDSLSISKLESNNNYAMVNYRMYNAKFDFYMDYTNNVSLCSCQNKKLVVVLVSLLNNGIIYKKNDNAKLELENKINKMAYSVSVAMLKIHNIINMDSNLRPKDEFINSVLVGLTTDFPVLRKAFTDNACDVYTMGRSTIMIIDDDKITCSLIAKIFNNDYDIIIANSGNEAIEILKNIKAGDVNIDCIFLDLIMPKLDGFTVLDYLNDNNYLKKLPVIIISGNYEKETRNRAYGYEIADMLEKPFNAQVVRHRIENLINLYRSSAVLSEMMLEQHQSLKTILSSIVNSYKVDNASNMKLLKKYMQILTMQLGIQMPELNINSNMVDRISNASIYYSIGDYTLPKSLLQKRGEYSLSEKELLHSANINGSSIIKYVSLDDNEIDLQYCYEISRYYHENFDGTGYPDGLKGSDIPISAQIASLVIEYIDLVNTIVPVDYDKVTSLILMESGKKFNPKVVEAFNKVRKEFETIARMGE